MNKKLLKSFAAAAMSVLAIACAKEQVGPVEGAMVEATFSVDVPGVIGTKAGEGTKATKLYYQVFDAEGAPVTGLPMKVKDIHVSTTVNFQLIKDQTYNFVFWAQTAEAGYYTVTDLRTITANYEGKNSNDENFDAFFAVEKAITINGPITKTVTLKRPFAQINVATTDVLIKAGETTVNVDFTGATSAVTVKDVPTVFSPLTDKLSSPVNALQFASAAIPEGNFAVTGSTETYKYLAVNYVFAPVDGTVYDVEAALNVAGKDVTVKVPSVPAKRNYRTNIYGNLLTTTADFNVVIDPGFAGDENMEMWDGSADAVTEVDGVYEIKNAAQLAWVSQQVNSRATTFSGKKVKLVDDIYLGGKSWTPIGTVVSTPSVAFCGTFDGNGKTIHDLNASDNTPVFSTAGLFGSVDGAIIKDLTIENAIVKSNHYAGVICGYSQRESKILNCKVSNVSVTSAPELIEAKWDNGDKVGGIAGYIESAEVSGCTVDNAAIQGYRDLGGIVGYANTTSKVTGNALKGIVTIIVDKSHNYKEYTSETEYDANPHVGEKSDVATVSDNTGEASIYYPTAIVSTQEELNAALETAAGQSSTIALASNSTVTLDNNALNEKNADVTIIGDGTQTFDVITNTVTAEGGQMNYQRGSSFTFKNLNIKAGEGNFDGVVCDELVFENCTITGKLTLFGKATFVNCVFENTMANQYSIWTWGGTDVKFDKCTFNTNGKAILLYGGAAPEANPTNLIVTNCTLNDRKNGAAGKAAIEIGNDYNATYNLTISDCVINGFAEGKNTGSKTWANKNSMDAAHLSVTIDGVKIQLS
jgi:phage baseplate assembly protein gpV